MARLSDLFGDINESDIEFPMEEWKHGGKIDDEPPEFGDPDYSNEKCSFPLTLYKTIKKEENLCLSPFSIAMALNLILAGAKGDTEREIFDLLGGTGEIREYHQQVADTAERILSCNHENLNIHIANALFPDQQLNLFAQYKDFVKKNYRADICPVVYSRPDQTAALINNWAGEHTSGMIDHIVDSDSLGPETLLALINAIYFKAKWDKEFNPARTSIGSFYKANRETVGCQMMYQCDYFDYYYSKKFKAVKMDYRKNRVSLLCLLPCYGLPLEDFEKSLSDDLINTVLTKMKNKEVSISLPRFKISGDLDLVAILQQMGLTDLFSTKADLSGMHEQQTSISRITHKAVIEVNESGTEAAAITAGFGELDEEPKCFHAERPFLFLILENTKNTILFMGRVTDPS